jgi:hypothetical protein
MKIPHCDASPPDLVSIPDAARGQRPRWLASNLDDERRRRTMNIVFIQPVVAIIAGILILVMPRLLNYIVAIYLILIGILGLT